MLFLPITRAAFAAFLFIGARASAAIIASTGFEGAPEFGTGYYYTYAYDYAGYGNGGPNVDLGGNAVNGGATVAAGLGVAGSSALQLFGDATAVPAQNTPYPTPADPLVQYSYWGMGGGAGLAVLNTPTSINLADYRIQMDIRTVGSFSGQATVEFSIDFQVPDDTLGGDPDTNGDAILSIEFTIATGQGFLVGNTFDTYFRTLDQNSRVTAGSLALFSQYVGQISNINVNVAANNGGGEFGLDAGNAVIVDNQMIEQVPEPAAAVLLGLTTGGALLRRRRGRKAAFAG